MSALTRKQKEALALLERSRRECSSTDDGLTTCVATNYDIEVDVAFIHWRTAAALKHRGLIEYGDWDPDGGTEIRLVQYPSSGGRGAGSLPGTRNLRADLDTSGPSHPAAGRLSAGGEAE